MSALQKLFKTTFIYGLATVLPRVLTVLLTRLYTDKLPTDEYGVVTVLFSYLVFFNVVLSYGMETAFFRFINKSERKAEVQATALTSIFITTLVFLVISFFFKSSIASWLSFNEDYVTYCIFILALDALVVIPFAWLRNNEMPIKYSVIKVFNVAVTLGFNIFFFLALPGIIQHNPSSPFKLIYFGENNISYVFIANLIGSAITLIILLPLYFRIGFRIDRQILQKMLVYALPVLVAGIAFSINEHFDKILLERLLPADIAKSEAGIYGACYKLGLFMTLFVTAFKLGVEPFFFSHANHKNAKKTYADITLYFSIFGAFILLFVVVYADLFKLILINNSAYWEAMLVVPIILIANLFLGIYHNLSVWYKITDKTLFGAYISLVGAALTLILNFWLIEKISYVGSAIATLVAYGSMMLLSFYFGQKNYPIPYNLKKIGLYLFSSIVFSVLAFYVFNRDLFIGSAFVLVFLCIIYFSEKNALKKIILKK